MTLTVFTSVSGSPGVTTATLAAAVHWPRPVLVVEADVSNVGQAMTGFFRAVLDVSAGMHQVTLAITRDALTVQNVLDAESGIAVPVHLLPAVARTPIPSIPAQHRMWVIPGWRDLTAVRAVQTTWSRLAVLAEQLDDHGVDMLVDLGRLAINDVRLPLLDSADQVVVVSTATITDLNRLHKRLRLSDLESRTASSQGRYRLLLVETPTAPVATADFARVVLPVAARVCFDPTGAAVFSHGDDDPRPARNRYRHDMRRAAAALSTPSVGAIPAGAR